MKVVMTGATGAVGSHTLQTLCEMQDVHAITVFDRRRVDRRNHAKVTSHIVDLGDSSSYTSWLVGHEAAICTVGVGDPSKVSKNDYTRIDHDIPLDFAKACKQAGVGHYSLLSSVSANPDSKNFYFRSKGQLENALKTLEFDRLSLFHPAMILTPERRYGAIVETALAVWPYLNPILIGGLRKLRGVKVERLGAALAHNLSVPENGLEVLEWDDFQRLASDK